MSIPSEKEFALCNDDHETIAFISEHCPLCRAQNELQEVREMIVTMTEHAGEVVTHIKDLFELCNVPWPEAAHLAAEQMAEQWRKR